MTGNLPASALVAGADYCYGYQWKTSGTECKIAATAVPTVGADSGAVCESRDKSGVASALYTADNASKTGASAWSTMDSKFTIWLTAKATENDKNGLLGQATKYDTDLGLLSTTPSTGIDALKTAADSAYTTANGELTTTTATYNTENLALTTKTTEVAGLLATLNGLKTDETNQIAEEAAQLAIKGLADADKTA